MSEVSCIMGVTIRRA